MARTCVRLFAARRFAGLLAVLALALCTTGFAQPSTAAAMDPMGMSPSIQVEPLSPAQQPDRAASEERAASTCPMDAMTMDCQLAAQLRPSTAPLVFAACAPSPAGQDLIELPDVQRAPPPPASREGPDLHRLCVSRT